MMTIFDGISRSPNDAMLQFNVNMCICEQCSSVPLWALTATINWINIQAATFKWKLNICEMLPLKMEIIIILDLADIFVCMKFYRLQLCY